MTEHDYDNDEKHLEALERVTQRLLSDRVARRRSAAHASNTRARMGHAPEDTTPRTLADALADSYLRTEALARAFSMNAPPDSKDSADSEDSASHESRDTPAAPACHGDLKDAARKLHAQGLTYGGIARKLRVNPSNVRRWCLAPDTHDTQEQPMTDHSPHPPEVRERALQLRAQGLSLSRVSKETGVPKGTLHGWFQLAGLTGYLPRREPTEPQETTETTETTERLAQIATQIKELEDERAKLLAPLRARRAALLAELATLNATLDSAPQD